MSFEDCAIHKYLIIPFVNVFTFGIYGNMYWLRKLEKQRNEFLDNSKNGVERKTGESDSG